MKHTVFFTSLLLILFIAGQAGFSQEAADALLRPEQVEYRAEDFEDPFGLDLIEQPVEKKEEKVEVRPLPPMVIQGVVWGGNLPQAIVNEKVVKVGDTIEEARVIEIRKDGIKVIFQGEEHLVPSPAKLAYPGSKKDAKRGGKNEE